jgi:hypothetical protein
VEELMSKYPRISACLASSTHTLQAENRALAEQISISTLGSHSDSSSESAASSVNNSVKIPESVLRIRDILVQIRTSV